MIRQRPPPSDRRVREYRDELWNLFLPIQHVDPSRSKINCKRRFVLGYYLNDDLSKNEIVHNCLFGCCKDPDMSLQRICHHVAWALCPFKPPVFARSRWTRWDTAIDFVGLLSGVHYLLKDLYLEYLGEERPSGTVQGSDVPVPEQAVAVLPNQSGSDEWNDLFQQSFTEATQKAPSGHESTDKKSDSAHTAEAPAAAETAADEETKQQEEKQSQSFDWAKFNKQQKLKAKLWILGDEKAMLARLCCMKEVAALMQDLMYRFLRISGKSWETKQRLLASKGEQRSYPFLEAARGVDVQLCLEGLYKLLHTKPACVSSQQNTASLQVLRLHMLSSGMCSMHVLLRMPRKNFPFKMFLAINCREHAEELLKAPCCMHDAMARKLLTEYVTYLHIILTWYV